MRESAVTELDRLLRGNQPDLACEAYGALTTLRGDDSRRVSDAASKSLDTYIEAWHQRTRAASGSSPVPQQPEVDTALVVSSPVAGTSAQPARTRLPRAVLIGVPAVVAALLLLVVAFAASRPGQSAVPVAAPAQPAPQAALPSAQAMVKVGAGTYRVGRDSPGGNYAPVQSITINDFWIDQYEVTNAQYAEFLSATRGLPPASWAGGVMPAGQPDFPVEGVTWDQADAFCKWAGKRLPSEAEWEIAARGKEGSLYPWGNDERVVVLPDSKTYAVGTIPANRSAFGVFDMAGNVWEWVGDPYAPVPAGRRCCAGAAMAF